MEQIFDSYTDRELEYLIRLYPWFSLALFEAAGRGIAQVGVEPYLLAGGVPDKFLPQPSCSATAEYLENEDISAPFMEVDNALVSETLAQIYLSQGHISRAIDVYEQLSLKNPEKSSYFASLIEDLQQY
ncbi:MAG: hypothetical protein RR286_03925 [Mucinivorans sp.]